jgi:hypothetical protein
VQGDRIGDLRFRHVAPWKVSSRRANIAGAGHIQYHPWDMGWDMVRLPKKFRNQWLQARLWCLTGKHWKTMFFVCFFHQIRYPRFDDCKCFTAFRTQPEGTRNWDVYLLVVEQFAMENHHVQ